MDHCLGCEGEKSFSVVYGGEKGFYTQNNTLSVSTSTI